MNCFLRTTTKLFLSIVLIQGFVLVVNPQKVQACSDQNIDSIELLNPGSCAPSTCSGGTPRCTIPPGSTTCQDSSIWEAVVVITYSDGKPTCSATAFFTGQEYCTGEFPQRNPNGNGIQGYAEYTSCPTEATCSESLRNSDPSHYFLQYCDTSSQSYCTGGYPGSCPANASEAGPGNYCQSWACGWNCTSPDHPTNRCSLNTTSLGGAQFTTYGGNNGCWDNCISDPTPSSSPVSCNTSTPTVEIGETASFTSSGGTGSITWSAPGGSPSSEGGGDESFSTTYSSSGTKTVTVTRDNNQSDTCSVTVSAPTTTPPAPTSGSGEPGCSISAYRNGNNVVVSVDGQNLNSEGYTTYAYTFTNSGSSTYQWASIPSGDDRTDSFSEAAATGVTALAYGTPPNIQCSGNPTFSSGDGSGGSGGTGGGTPTPSTNPTPSSCGDCIGPFPGCGQSGPGVCQYNSSQSCTITAQSCADDGRVSVRFLNADCSTPYNGPETLSLLADNSRGPSGKHNSIQYGPSGYTGSHAYAGPCDQNNTHPYKDGGYQINDAGGIEVCPAVNFDGTGAFHQECSGDWVCDYGDCDTSSNNCGCTSACDGDLNEFWDGAGNDECKPTPDEPSTWPRCFSVERVEKINILAGSSHWLYTFGYNEEYAPRDQPWALSVGAPTNYKLKVYRLCGGGDCPGWNGFEYGYSQQGALVKDFDTPVAGRTNYWASPFQTPDGSTSVLAYDVCVRGAVYKISGNVFVDYFADGGKNGPDTDYGGAKIYLSGAGANKQATTDGSGNYEFTELDPGTYTLQLEVPSLHRATTPNPISVVIVSENQGSKNFGITPIAYPWFQTKDADLLSFSNIVSRIPIQCTLSPSCTPYLSLAGDGGSAGVISYGGSEFNLGYGTASVPRWVTKSTYSGGSYNYAHFARRMPADATVIGPSINGTDIVSQTPSSGYKFFTSNGNLTIENAASLGGKKAIVFVNGDLTIKGPINLTRGSGFFATIASGSINIDSGVAGDSAPVLEGFFIADNAIRTGTKSPANDTKLYVRGVLAAWGNVILQRDLDPNHTGTGNNITPAEYVEYAPDLVLLFPHELQRDNPVWEEIAP